LTTNNKDFKVKNGLIVNNGGTFGGAVTVGTPTLGTHAATKSYVDSLVGGMAVGSTAPSSPDNGDLWFDTITERINVYYGSTWVTVATIEDTLNLPQHIHDTSIDGNGLIVTTFVDAGTSYDPQAPGQDAGDPNTSSWSLIYDGGVSTDNFN
jgi:hypothetical protein